MTVRANLRVLEPNPDGVLPDAGRVQRVSFIRPGGARGFASREGQLWLCDRGKVHTWEQLFAEFGELRQVRVRS